MRTQQLRYWILPKMPAKPLPPPVQVIVPPMNAEPSRPNEPREPSVRSTLRGDTRSRVSTIVHDVAGVVPSPNTNRNTSCPAFNGPVTLSGLQMRNVGA